MVFLHYRPLRELNLPSLVGAEQVTVIVPAITIRELDKHKDTHPTRKIRDRAGKVLRKIYEAIEKSTKMDGEIGVEFFPDFPSQQLSDLGLNPDWSDDVLIASIVSYMRKSQGQCVTLISQDVGPKLKCLQYGINAIELNESLKLPAERDETEKENERLRRELERLSQAVPRICVSLSGSDASQSYKSFELLPLPDFREEELEKQMVVVRAEHPLLEDSHSEGPKSMGLSVAGIAQEMLRKDYNDALHSYFNDMEDYLRKLHRHKDILSRTVSFEVAIHNLGTAPATDVDILLRFPKGFRLLSEANFPKCPVVPSQPLMPTDPGRSLFSPLSYMISHGQLSPQVLCRVNHPNFGISESPDGNRVVDKFNQLKHGIPRSLPRLHVVFSSHSDARSFNCGYEIRPANLTEPVLGELHFHLKNSAT